MLGLFILHGWQAAVLVVATVIGVRHLPRRRLVVWLVVAVPLAVVNWWAFVETVREWWHENWADYFD